MSLVIGIGNVAQQWQDRSAQPKIELRLLQEGQKRLELRLDRLEAKIDELRSEANERERKRTSGN